LSTNSIPNIKFSMSGLGQGCDVIVTGCCRSNISEAEGVELKHSNSVWDRVFKTFNIEWLVGCV